VGSLADENEHGFEQMISTKPAKPPRHIHEFSSIPSAMDAGF
jgi:hypothetical protein